MNKYNKNRINNKSYLESRRKKLRSRMTVAEAFLWRHIKNKQVEGMRFRRQFSIDNYILDFYCFELKLGIELDGHGHFTEEGIRKDEERSNNLKKHGVEILRFENQLVFTHTETVLREIREKIMEKTK